MSYLSLLRGLILSLGLSLAWGGVAVAAPGREALFSPWDDIEGRLITVLNDAKTSVQVQAYLLTSKPITRALVAARGRGLNVAVLADAEMARKGNAEQLDVLVANGVSVAMETAYAAAHNKIVIVDADGPSPVLVTGSYNFTWSAQARNAENVLLVTDDSPLSTQYLRNWRRHWQNATDYTEWLRAGRPGYRAEERAHAK